MHRDIKPDNILLNDANDPIICDFSLAKVVYPTSVLAAAAAAPKAGGKKKKAKKEKRKLAGVEGIRNSEGAGIVGFPFFPFFFLLFFSSSFWLWCSTAFYNGACVM